MADRLRLTGLTKAQAEECLDWLQNHGYPRCRARLDGEVWTIIRGSGPRAPQRAALGKFGNQGPGRQRAAGA